jgi:hypothetical protein
MKKIFLFFAIVLTLCGCNNDDNKNETLPPATQIGANTAGCLVDGEILIPKGNNNIFQCFYQLVDGEYYFSISFRDKSSNISKACTIISRKADIEQGKSYLLNIGNSDDVVGYGGEYNIGITEPFSYDTNSVTIGELTITKLDFTNNIVSGTFWFDAINSSGEIKKIREGRFDAQFTQ